MKVKIRSRLYCIIFALFYCLNLSAVDKTPKIAPPAKIMATAGLLVNQLDDIQKPYFTQTPTVKTIPNLFLGAEYFLYPHFSVEMDFVVGRNQFAAQPEDGVLASEESLRAHFPLLFRWILGKWTSLALGVYASYRIGSVRSLVARENSYEEITSAYNYGNHGLVASFRQEFPIDEEQKRSFVLEYRYRHSLTPRVNEKRDWQNIICAFRWQL